jgi:hypothetical protein
MAVEEPSHSAAVTLSPSTAPLQRLAAICRSCLWSGCSLLAPKVKPHVAWLETLVELDLYLVSVH